MRAGIRQTCAFLVLACLCAGTACRPSAPKRTPPAPPAAPAQDHGQQEFDGPVRIEGTVLDEEHRPCAANVLAYRVYPYSPEPVKASAGADGKFVLCLPSRSWYYYAESEGRLSRIEDIWAGGQKARSIKLQLRRAMSASGTVTDTKDLPIRGVEVTCEEEGNTVARCTTDEAGKYRLSIPPCVSRLWFCHDRYASQRVDLDPESKRGDAVDVRLTLGACVKGRVMDPEGHPAAKVSLRVTNVPRTAGSSRLNDFFDFSGTDAEGRYARKNLPPGRYEVVVEPHGKVAKASAPFDLNEGDTREVDVALTNGGTIHGVVRRKSDGAPVADQHYWVTGLPRDHELRCPSTIDLSELPRKTDECGEFTVENVEEGRQTVGIRREGFVPLDQVVEVHDGKTTEVELLLSEGGRIHGRVLKADGTPFAVASLMAWSSTGRPCTGVDETDATGSYEIRGLGDGEYRIEASDYKHSGETMPPARYVRLTGGASVECNFPPPIQRTLVGTLRRDGKVVPETALTFSNVRQDRFSRTARTDANGSYRVEGMVSGEYLITVGEAWAVQAVSHTVVPDAAGEATRDIDLAGGSVRVRMVEEWSGAPVGMAGIAALRGDGGCRGRAETLERVVGWAMLGGDGGCTLKALPQGTYDLVVYRDTLAAAYGGRVTVRDREETVLPELRVPAGVPIDLEVVDRGGNGCMATILMRDLDHEVELGSTLYGTRFTSEGGELRLPAAPGHYLLSAHADGFGTTSRELVVKQGEPASVKLVLPTEAVLRVTLRTAAGTPIQGATLMLRTADGRSAEAPTSWFDQGCGRSMTDETGTIERHGLGPGRYVGELRAGDLSARFEVALGEGERKDVAATPR